MVQGNKVAFFHQLLSSPNPDTFYLLNPNTETVQVFRTESVRAFVRAHYDIGRHHITTASQLPSGYADFALVYNLEPNVDGKFSLIDATTGAIVIEAVGPSLAKMGLGRTQQSERAIQYRNKQRRETVLLGKLGYRMIDEMLGDDAPSLFPNVHAAPAPPAEPSSSPSPTTTTAHAARRSDAGKGVGGKVAKERTKARTDTMGVSRAKRMGKKKAVTAETVSGQTGPLAHLPSLIPLSPEARTSKATPLTTFEFNDFDAAHENNLANAIAGSSSMGFSADDVTMGEGEDWAQDLPEGTDLLEGLEGTVANSST